MKTRLREMRLSKNLSQTALADYIECSQNTISRIELEKSSPAADILLQLSNYFNTSIDYILCRTNQKEIYPTLSPYPNRDERLKKYMQKLQMLPDKDREVVYSLIECMINANQK